MSVQAPAWFATQYADRAMHIYQTKGNRLRPMVTPCPRIEGEKAIFMLAGVSKAKKKDRGERNVPGGGERKTYEVILAEWTAFDTVKEFDLDRLTVDEREIVYKAGANALGRATDKELYDVAYAKVGAAVDASLDFSAGAFSAANALLLCSALQDDKVEWDGNVFCGLPSVQWNQFLANKVVNSADHVQDLPFAKATDTRFWNGVNWFLQVEQDAEDLYPVPAGGKQDALIWHKSALGWANNEQLRVIPQWDNYEDEWTINMKAKGAATTLQEGKGIKRFRTSSTKTIAIQ